MDENNYEVQLYNSYKHLEDLLYYTEGSDSVLKDIKGAEKKEINADNRLGENTYGFWLTLQEKAELIEALEKTALIIDSVGKVKGYQELLKIMIDQLEYNDELMSYEGRPGQLNKYENEFKEVVKEKLVEKIRELERLIEKTIFMKTWDYESWRKSNISMSKIYDAKHMVEYSYVLLNSPHVVTSDYIEHIKRVQFYIDFEIYDDNTIHYTDTLFDNPK
ncbi:hypothetical protein AN643_00490 [Candidatus Epulonipiscioides saccharophilum]|nr:hypothetical protein AN643_00490 [Epulopiscium sp. SCG-B10WGA-EpuloB]